MTRHLRRAPFLAGALLLVAGAALAAPTAYDIDAVHSSVVFRIKHLGVGYVYGRFNEFSGKVTVDDADLSKASVQMTVKAASVDTGNGKRDEHLRSPDFFNVAQFPEMRFASKTVAKVEGGYRIEGDLTLHGATRPVTVRMELVGEVDDPWGNHRRGYHGTFSIRRTDYGMNYDTNVLGDEVDITLAFETTHKK